MGSYLSTLPRIENSPSCIRSSWNFPLSWCLFWSPSHWHCWSITALAKLPVSPHNYWPFHSLASCYSTFGDNRRIDRLRLCDKLARKLWNPVNRHYRCGSQFESSLFSLITSTFGIQWNCTTPYHPISNGMIERFHRQLKSSLKAYNNPNNWSEILPLILLGIRNTLKADLSMHSFATRLRYNSPLARSILLSVIRHWSRPNHICRSPSRLYARTISTYSSLIHHYFTSYSTAPISHS